MNAQVDPRTLLLESFRAAVAAADPLEIVAAHLPPPHAGGRTLVVGAGKAAASMALAVERAYQGKASLEGIVVTRYAHGLPTEHIRVIEAGHPVPDEAGEQAAADILARVQALGPDDRLIVLVSGGGSSLLSLPAEGIPMADLKATTRELLRCGAPITDMNIVRKHTSRIQGGRLAQASRAPVTTLIVSDVAGDDPSAIASGPTVPDASTYADALAILKRYGAAVPTTVQAHLERGARGEIEETPKPGDPLFMNVDNRMIATAHDSLEAAAAEFRRQGVNAVVLGDTVTGEAQEVARVYAALVREIRAYYEYCHGQARECFEAGMDLATAAATISLDRWADWGEPERIVTLLDTCFREFSGRSTQTPMAELFALMAAQWDTARKSGK